MDQQDVSKSEARWRSCQEQRAQETAEAAKREKASRKQLLDKYHLQVVNTAAITPSCRQQQAPKSKVLLADYQNCKTHLQCSLSLAAKVSKQKLSDKYCMCIHNLEVQK